MSVSVDDIKKLREMTGAGMMDAKKALIEADGSIDGAVESLRKKGAASVAKRAGREAKAGLVESYVHAGRIGVLVEVNCETDFVARTDDFKSLSHDIAMHIAAMAPEYIDPDSVPEGVVQKEREIYSAEVGDKPAEITQKIVDGKLAKYYDAVCLTNQPFVKNQDQTVGELITEAAAKLGEKIVVRQFSRIELGGAL